MDYIIKESRLIKLIDNYINELHREKKYGTMNGYQGFLKYIKDTKNIIFKNDNINLINITDIINTLLTKIYFFS